MNHPGKIALILACAFALSIPALGSEIHTAAAAGDLETVKRLVAGDGDLVNAVNARGSTALHQAALSGRTNVAAFLLEKGADLEAIAGDGSTPIFWAAWAGKVKTLEFLLKEGANLQAAAPGGWTALHSAARQGQRGTARVLLEQGMPVDAAMTNGMTPLAAAAEAAQTRMISDLLEAGADPNGVPDSQESPLSAAARGNSEDTIDQLIEAGAALTPDFLVNAIFLEQIHLVSRFLDQGMDPSTVNRDGWSLLQAAVIVRRAELVELLLEHGADLAYVNHNHQTALSIAAGREVPDILELLIEAGADLDVMDEQGGTALQTAVIHNDLESVNLLLAKGVDPNQREVYTGKTMLHVAALRGNREMAASMLERGTRIDATDDLGKTALHYAARYGHRLTADLLKAKGAKKEKLEENYGKSPRLAEGLKEKQVTMWYLGHCGWALKTRNHLLIFDYCESTPRTDTPSLANGHIDPAEIADQKVTVFVTHEHGDHFHDAIFGWNKELKDLTYVFGFQPEALPPDRYFPPDLTGYETMAPRESRKINGMEITTLRANDAGVGFLVEVDGLKIYHAGDHAGWQPGQREGFTQEIDFMAQQTDRVDLAFVNVTGCHAHDPQALKEGNRYTVDKLHPSILVPTHGLNREYTVYRGFAATVEEEGWGVKVLCADFRGDSFFVEGDEFRVIQ